MIWQEGVHDFILPFNCTVYIVVGSVFSGCCSSCTVLSFINTCCQVRRVLFIVRDEYERVLRGKPEEGDPSDSLQKLFTADSAQHDLARPFPELKSSIMEALQVSGWLNVVVVHTDTHTLACALYKYE